MAASAPQIGRPDRLERLLEEARRLNVEIGNRSTEELRQAVSEAWIEENREAMEAWNVWVEKNGLPLDRYRAF